MVLPKLSMPTFHLQQDYCTKEIKTAANQLTNHLLTQEKKRNIAKWAVPVTLGITALAILNIAAPIFDAFINLALDLKTPNGKPRLITLITFPADLVLKVVRTALNVVGTALSPAICIVNIGERLHAMR